MTTTHFQAEPRVRLQPAELRRLRRKGRLPAIVFGKRADNTMIHLATSEFQKWLRQGASGFIELEVAGKQPFTVLLEDIQRHSVTRELLHVDFQLVQSHEVVRTKIPVKFSGTPIGTKQGGVVQIQRAFIEVEALPKHLPTEVELDIGGMEVGESLHVRDAEFASEVTVISESHEFLLSVVKP